MRVDWDRVYKMPALEFLNVICYRKDKAVEDRRALDEWKKKN